jgi:hypothetical protein
VEEVRASGYALRSNEGYWAASDALGRASLVGAADDPDGLIESVESRIAVVSAAFGLSNQRSPQAILRHVRAIQWARRRNGLPVYGSRCIRAAIAALVPFEQR